MRIFRKRLTLLFQAMFVVYMIALIAIVYCECTCCIIIIPIIEVVAKFATETLSAFNGFIQSVSLCAHRNPNIAMLFDILYVSCGISVYTRKEPIEYNAECPDTTSKGIETNDYLNFKRSDFTCSVE
jgi:hypothetical protein